jgi:hypothetical protein
MSAAAVVAVRRGLRLALPRANPPAVPDRAHERGDRDGADDDRGEFQFDRREHVERTEPAHQMSPIP